MAAQWQVEPNDSLLLAKFVFDDTGEEYMVRCPIVPSAGNHIATKGSCRIAQSITEYEPVKLKGGNALAIPMVHLKPEVK